MDENVKECLYETRKMKGTSTGHPPKEVTNANTGGSCNNKEIK